MPSFLDCRIDADAILADIEAIARIESPTSDAAGVNGVLDVIAGWFEGTGAVLERFKTDDDRFGDMLRVTLRSRAQRARHPGAEPRRHVHPDRHAGRPLPFRREGNKVYGPGVYDMKGGLVLAIAAFRQLARDKVTRPLPLTFLFNPDEEVGSVGSRKAIEQEGARHRYVLVTEPKRGGGKIVTERKGTGRYVVRARGRPAHAGAAHHKGKSAIRAMAEVILPIEGFTDYKRGITTNVGLVSGGTGVNVIPEHCTANVDLRVRDLEAAAEMERRFHALAASDADVEITVTGGIHRPPFCAARMSRPCSPRPWPWPSAWASTAERRPLRRRLRRQFHRRQGHRHARRPRHRRRRRPHQPRAPALFLHRARHAPDGRPHGDAGVGVVIGATSAGLTIEIGKI